MRENSHGEIEGHPERYEKETDKDGKREEKGQAGKKEKGPITLSFLKNAANVLCSPGNRA